MITLSFYRSESFDTSEIPAEWRANIMVSRFLNTYRVTISVDVEDSSYRYRALMQRPQLALKFSLPYFVEFPVGTSCTFQGQTFTLNAPENLKRQGSRNIEYSMTLGTKEDNLALYKFRNSVDGRLKWSMCAKPHEFIEEIVKCLNKRDGANVWYCQKSNIIEATEKTIEFNHVYCDSALSSVAETFETEYEIINHSDGRYEIALHKVEYSKDNPLPLSYGRGNGFVPGVGRTTEQDGQPVKRLYCQGGDRNIDRSKYGTLFNYSNNPGELRLPKSQTLEYEGREYTTDPDGFYIERSDVISTAKKEDSLDCSEIYPSYIGTVSSVKNPKPDKNWWDIIDENIPPSLNFNNYLIAGESMTIIFQSGMLAGREFEVKYRHDERRWELVPMEEDGITFPNDTFKPNADAAHPDTYAVFGIMLPEAYICENETKTGAAWDMFREGARYLYEHEDQKFTFAGELQSLYAKRNWTTIGAYMKVGAYIHFTDEHFAVNGLDIRIIGVKEYINSPFAPTLEISNSIQSPTTASSELENISNQEVFIEDKHREAIQYSKRRFRDALETISMLEDAQLANFNSAISPVAIQTMAMLVGDESLQFLIGLTIKTIGKDTWGVSFNNNHLTAPAGFLRHMTLGVNSITSEHETSDYLTWKMPALNKTPQESNKKYYLYAKVRRVGMVFDLTLQDYVNLNPGEWVLDNKSHALDEDSAYYYLLVGMLNSEFRGERSFVTMYGFTEILPGQITTDVIKSAAGDSYFNLKDNRFALGEKLEFNVSDDPEDKDILRLRGALVQSASGETSPLPCYRGVFSKTVRYYRGDVVSYTTPDEITSTYICKATASGGIINLYPTEEAYWDIYAKGVKGNPGTNGKDAPIMVFCGNYDSNKTYYGNAFRIDCVKYGDTYYVAKPDAPNGTSGFVGYTPTESADYWRAFGASFESIATALMLAEKATIGNWYIAGDNIASTHGTVNGQESDDFTHPSFRPDVILDGATGELVLYSGKYPRVRLSNASVSELFNETLLQEAKINRYFQTTLKPYIPYGGSQYRSSVGILGTISIGHMEEDSVIKIEQFSINFNVPYNDYNPSGTSVTASVNGVDLKVTVKRDGVAVTSFSGTSGVAKSSGETLSIGVTSPHSYTVPSGGGNYTLEISLKDIGFTVSNSGLLKDTTMHAYVKGSYIHGGFNRTVIGNDGIGSFWNNAVFVFSQNGLITRFGNIGFKVSPAGIQRSNNANLENPTWTNL